MIMSMISSGEIYPLDSLIFGLIGVIIALVIVALVYSGGGSGGDYWDDRSHW